jgi:hypothetical protein
MAFNSFYEIGYLSIASTIVFKRILTAIKRVKALLLTKAKEH